MAKKEQYQQTNKSSQNTAEKTEDSAKQTLLKIGLISGGPEKIADLALHVLNNFHKTENMSVDIMTNFIEDSNIFQYHTHKSIFLSK